MLKKLMRKRRFRICLIIALIWCTMFTTDYVRAFNNQRPIFAVPILAYRCGIVRHFGIGYQVIVYRTFTGMIVDIGIWIMPLRPPSSLPIEDIIIYPNNNYCNEQIYSQDFDDIVDVSTIPDINIESSEIYIDENIFPDHNYYTLSIIEKILQDINEDFKIENYNVSIYYNGSGVFTIVVTRIIGGFMVNSEFIIFIVDNEIF